MPYLACLVCGALSKQGLCPVHRTREAQGYDYRHRRSRREEIAAHPYCAYCGHEADPYTGRCDDQLCPRCPLQRDHVQPIRQGRVKNVRQTYQILCRQCNRKKG